MSGKMVGAVWELDLPHAEAWVLMALADHAHHDGSNMFASQKLLAWKTGYSERQIRRILESLEEQGLIVPESGGVGRGMIRSYRIELAAAKKKEPMPENRTNCPQNKKGKPVKMSGSIEDKMSAYQEEKEDILSAEKADISEPISGHFDVEKRTFPTEKADISDTGPYKERARLTVENHVNPIEPEESAHARETAAGEETQDEAFARIDALTKTVFRHYVTNGHIDQRFEKRVTQEVGTLNQQGATVESLEAFLAQRNRLPTLNFLAQDYATWKANQTRQASAPNGTPAAKQKAAVLVGMNPPAAAAALEERVPDAQILQAGADMLEDYPDEATRPEWAQRVIDEAAQIKAGRKQEAA